jgi:hypothetical protein
MTVSPMQSSPSLLAYRATGMQQHANSLQLQASSLRQQAAVNTTGVAATDRETPAENRGVDSDDHHPTSRGTFSTYA